LDYRQPEIPTQAKTVYRLLKGAHIVSIEQDSKRRELERLWRKSYWLSGSVFVVAAFIFLNDGDSDGDRMFALSLMLMRKFHLPLEPAELLVTRYS
jgi:hypothetical protein